MTQKIILGFYLIVAILLSGCPTDPQKETKALQTLIVKKHALTNHLFFSGTIKPIKTVNISSPVEGIIKEIYFHYGQSVPAHQRLLLLSSDKLAQNYQTALVDYLKTKDSYFSAQERFIGTQELMKQQLIAKELFDAEQRQLANRHLDYLQARYKLLSLSQEQPFKDDKLSLDDIKTAAKIIHKPYRLQTLYASMAGTLLAAPKSEESTESGQDETNKLAIGSQVKAGQTLLTIADLRGIMVDIQVPEIDIHRLRIGLPVNITGAAFPGIRLLGQISAISAQAKPNSRNLNGVPTFTVEITVPQLTAAQRQQIYVGMSAKVDICIKEAPELTLPIQAVYEQGQYSYVTVLNQHKLEKRLVTTGRTTQSHVVINSGLQAGEQVVIHD